jgi:hypothetical protein
MADSRDPFYIVQEEVNETVSCSEDLYFVSLADYPLPV